MLKMLQKALRVQDIRKRLLFTFLMLLVIRFGSQLPVPGTDPSYLKKVFSGETGDAFNFLSALTGGSFESFSILALSITPYITASIIIQLMTIAIPALEDMQKDGQEGRKKMQRITRFVTVGLALIQSVAMSIGFGRQGLLTNYTWYNVVVTVVCLTCGSAFLMWIGERITDKGIGNGISIVLLVNIISRLPDDVVTIYDTFLSGRTVAVQVVVAVVIIAILALIVAYNVILNDAERRIPVQYAQKVVGRRSMGGRSTYIPIKVCTANVIPVIFASSIMSMPVMIAQFFNVDYNTFGGWILHMLSSSYWFRPSMMSYSIGAVIYILLVVMFAYFYTNITFNPLEVADNMKKSGGFIPGIRPGKPTSDYLTNVLNYLVFIGAVGLVIACVFPMVVTGVGNISSLSLMGTSLIIIVGVILETLQQINGRMIDRQYDSIF